MLGPTGSVTTCASGVADPADGRTGGGLGFVAAAGGAVVDGSGGRLDVEGSALASGVYVVRLTVGSFEETRKMLLIR